MIWQVIVAFKADVRVLLYGFRVQVIDLSRKCAKVEHFSYACELSMACRRVHMQWSIITYWAKVEDGRREKRRAGEGWGGGRGGAEGSMGHQWLSFLARLKALSAALWLLQ